jgi:hypothetical protein
MQLSALLPASPHPRANAFEVFKADRPLRAFGSLNDAFAHRVVYVAPEAAFLPSKLLQPPPRCFRPQPLQFHSQPSMTVAHVVEVAAAVDGAVRVASDGGHAQVNPKRIDNFLWFRFLDLARHQQIPATTMKQQIALTLPACKHRSLLLAADERDCLSPVECPDRNRRGGHGFRMLSANRLSAGSGHSEW